jgi:DNA-binding NarL/FixJ family response regulator
MSQNCATKGVVMNVFIVENTLAIRDSLQSVLSDMPEVKVVGQAMNQTGAIERIGALQPDVVILDLGLQSGSGVGVLENVKECHAQIKVIVSTHYTDELCLDRCKRAGADYFFDKSSELMQLREILREWAHTDHINNRCIRPRFECSRTI